MGVFILYILSVHCRKCGGGGDGDPPKEACCHGFIGDAEKARVRDEVGSARAWTTHGAHVQRERANGRAEGVEARWAANLGYVKRCVLWDKAAQESRRRTRADSASRSAQSERSSGELESYMYVARGTSETTETGVALLISRFALQFTGIPQRSPWAAQGGVLMGLYLSVIKTLKKEKRREQKEKEKGRF